MKGLLQFGFFPAGLLTALAFFSLPVRGQEEPAGYLFEGVSISARSGFAYLPVVAVDKRKIHVDTGARTKKVGLLAPCLANASLRVSDKFLEVLEMDVVTSSLTNLQRDSEAIADMQRAEAQKELHVAILKSKGVGLSRGPAGQSLAREIRKIEQNHTDLQASLQEGLDSRSFHASGVADAVFVNLEFIPWEDINGAYCVFAVSYLAIDVDTGRLIGRRRTARVKYLGDLQEGKVFKMKKRFSFSEFSLEQAEHSIHIFSGEGEEIAMSNSLSLKEIPASEFERIESAVLSTR